VHNDGHEPRPARLPDPPMPRPPRRRLRPWLAASAVAVACTAGALASLRVHGNGTGAVPAVTQPSVRIPPGAIHGQHSAPAILLPEAGIYRLLPLTATQLTAAASVATSFTDAYGTYSYAEPASAYLARLRPYTSAGLQSELAEAAAAPGLLQQRARQHASATATATVTAIRDIVSTTVTFIVTVRQTARSQGTASTSTTEYAVTAAPGTDGWLTYDIEPASAGQAGSAS